jgi:hypothetical protein
MFGFLSHNRSVRPRRTIWAFVLLALLASVVAPGAAAFWHCEGRVCGTTASACCCLSPEDGQDANCLRAAASPVSTACASQCGCVLVVQDASPATLRSAGTSFGSLYAPPFVLPAALTVDLPTSSLVTRVIETRGPPLLRLPLATPSLRAPPVS